LLYCSVKRDMMDVILSSAKNPAIDLECS
jgi:hypothetical protein